MATRNTKMARNVQAAFAEGYRVQEDGSVMSPYGHVLSTRVQRNGYLRVQCNKHSVYVHQLAAYQKFGIAALAVGTQVRHGKDGRLINTSSNINIGSAAQNYGDIAEDVRRRITRAAVTSSGRKKRKLSSEQARSVKGLRAEGLSLRAIARKFGVSKPVIQLILAGKTYKE